MTSHRFPRRFLGLTFSLTLLGLIGFGGFPGRVLANVPGGNDFPLILTERIDDHDLTFILTGVAVRKWFSIRFYTIASYCEEDTEIETAQELLDAEVEKRLHLQLVRKVPSRLVAIGLERSIKANDPEKKFVEERKELTAYINRFSLAAGDQIHLKSMPGIGFSCQLNSQKPLVIKDEAFAHTIWKTYLGDHCVSNEIKRNLVKRMRKGAEDERSAISLNQP